MSCFISLSNRNLLWELRAETSTICTEQNVAHNSKRSQCLGAKFQNASCYYCSSNNKRRITGRQIVCPGRWVHAALLTCETDVHHFSQPDFAHTVPYKPRLLRTWEHFADNHTCFHIRQNNLHVLGIHRRASQFAYRRHSSRTRPHTHLLVLGK